MRTMGVGGGKDNGTRKAGSLREGELSPLLAKEAASQHGRSCDHHHCSGNEKPVFEQLALSGFSRCAPALTVLLFFHELCHEELYPFTKW